MSEARINRISNEKGDGGPSLSGITTFSGLNYFVPPKGTTAERPSDCPPGSIRFNTDSAHLEYWDGLQWLEFEATNDELGGGTGSNTGLGTRGLFGGGSGNPTPRTDTIDQITISTLGNSLDFGNLITTQDFIGSCASSTRGIWLGGNVGPGPHTDLIQYVTFASTGNAVDFNGNLTDARGQAAACSSSTRGLCFGGYTPGSINTIDYITMASTGVNAQEFGDLYDTSHANAACSSSVRGICAGGSGALNVIQYVTISTLGNSQDFGDLTRNVRDFGGFSNATRGVFGSGNAVNIIDFITISSTGDAQDFGDLVVTMKGASGAASPTRGVFGGSYNPDRVDINYIEIATTGNAKDFGDLLVSRGLGAACSNGHGGL